MNARKAGKIKRAAARFKRFTGHDAEQADPVQFDVPEVALRIGDCLGIMYRTVRDGKTEDYIHRFNPRSRPQLAASEDGSILILLGGAYQFTNRGIVDKG